MEQNDHNGEVSVSVSKQKSTKSGKKLFVKHYVSWENRKNAKLCNFVDKGRWYQKRPE